MVSDDLPEPDTPVTTTNLLRGIATLMFFRLCTLAPLIKISLPVAGADANKSGDFVACFVLVAILGKCRVCNRATNVAVSGDAIAILFSKMNRNLPEKEKTCLMYRYKRQVRSLATLAVA